VRNQADAQSPEKCDGSFHLSDRLLREDDLSEDDLADIFAVLKAQGGNCDCEILYNVSDSNRLKSSYWRNKATHRTAVDLREST
jgi:hypothetical protein